MAVAKANAVKAGPKIDVPLDGIPIFYAGASVSSTFGTQNEPFARVSQIQALKLINAGIDSRPLFADPNTCRCSIVTEKPEGSYSS